MQKVTEFEHVKRYWKVDFSTNKLEIGQIRRGHEKMNFGSIKNNHLKSYSVSVMNKKRIGYLVAWMLWNSSHLNS